MAAHLIVCPMRRCPRCCKTFSKSAYDAHLAICTFKVCLNCRKGRIPAPVFAAHRLNCSKRHCSICEKYSLNQNMVLIAQAVTSILVLAATNRSCRRLSSRYIAQNAPSKGAATAASPEYLRPNLSPIARLAPSAGAQGVAKRRYRSQTTTFTAPLFVDNFKDVMVAPRSS